MVQQEQKIRLADDYEGPVEATLIRMDAEKPATRAVLYLHGYIDYFFQDHMARWFAEAGWNFFALDLRKYGRSLLPHQHPDYCRDMREYYPEIDASIREIIGAGNRFITLMGHSTGGLLASLYASQGALRAAIGELVLNSPFFEFNTSRFKRDVLIPLSVLWSKMVPFASMKNELSPFYFDSIHRSARGEWDFNLKWKPREGIPLYFAWLGAVRRGQRQLRRGLAIGCPVLVLHSEASFGGKVWKDAFMRGDTVLNVGDIRRYAPCLGGHVTVREIEGGLHDLVLSAPDVRAKVLRIMEEWMERNEAAERDRSRGTDVPLSEKGEF